MTSDNSQSFKDPLPIGAESPENKDQGSINDSQKNKDLTSGQFFPQYNINISIPQNIPLTQTTNFPSYSIPTQSQLSNQIFPQYNVNIVLPQNISSPPNCNIPSFTQTSQNQSTSQIPPQCNLNVSFSQNNPSENTNRNDKKEDEKSKNKEKKERKQEKKEDTNTKQPVQSSILSESDYCEYEQDTLSDKEEKKQTEKEKANEKTSKIEKAIKTRSVFGGFSLGKGDPREISNPSRPIQFDNTGRKYSQSKAPQMNFMSLSKSESSLVKLSAALNGGAWIGQKSMQDSPPFGSSWETPAFPPEPIDLWKSQNGTGVFRSSSAANLASICAANLASNSVPNIESVSDENMQSTDATKSASKSAAKMASNSAKNTESGPTANPESVHAANLVSSSKKNVSNQSSYSTSSSQTVSKSFYSFSSVSYASKSRKKDGNEPNNDDVDC